MSLETLANLAELIGAATVVGGILFAMIQLREFRQQRNQSAAVELMRAIQDRGFVAATTRLSHVPDGVAWGELRSHDGVEEAALAVGATYEMVGVMTQRRIIPFSVVQDMMGGLSLRHWRKLARWVEDVRAQEDMPEFMEWWQWLAERLEQHGTQRGGDAAHRRFRSWRPTR